MRSLAILLALSAIPAAVVAQAASPPVIPLNHLPAIAGEYFPLASTATGLTYHIYVRHPQGYDVDAEKRYPVIYLLDGDSAFPLLAAQHLFLTIDDKLPEAIVVGIAYGGFDPKVNKRDVDFGPRAEAFHRFLETELMPRVEGRTRADPQQRVLVGQSYGGSFVLWSALNRPNAFWGRIASNPSFRLNAAQLQRSPAAPQRRDLQLYVVSGTANSADARKQAIRWVTEQSSRSSPLAVKRIDIEGGTHAADLPAAYRAALRELFDWKPATSDPR